MPLYSCLMKRNICLQKVDKLQAVCKELENQIKDLEALAEENERQQLEWNTMK